MSPPTRVDVVALAPAVLSMVAVFAGSRFVQEFRGWRRQRGLVKRVGAVAPWPAQVADELELSFRDRIIRPWLHALADAWSRRLYPPRVQEELTRRLRLAGMGMSASVFITARWAVTFSLIGVGVLLDAAGLVPAGYQWLVPMALGGMGYLYWGARVTTRGQMAQEEIERALPEAFDLLSVSVAAGLSFEAALRRTAPRLPGAAGREFARVVADLEVGLTRLEALGDLAERTRIVELARFVTLVAQAERAGAGMASVLHAEAERVKEVRIARARERAALVPVKILFPLVLFILPALFVTILGGGIISMVKAFGSGGL
jgi:tight adherence protein C